MAERDVEMLAPCVVVAGPAESGKTSFLHQLDEALQNHPDRPEVYVVKGSPDATGRYLYHVKPELRQEREKLWKGIWTPEAVEIIRGSIMNARRDLELVLVDFGGKHSSSNAAILSCCTHYLLVARRFDEEVREREEGMESWQRVCVASGLLPVARIHSLLKSGCAAVTTDHCDEPLEATYRSDACLPGDSTNQEVVNAIVRRLLRLRLRREAPPYLDLRLARDWTVEDLKDLAGLAPVLENNVRQHGGIRLGGRAPIWAYLGAMHRVLDVNHKATVEVFDPKLSFRFVRIPEECSGRAEEFPPEFLECTWERREEVWQLNLRILTQEGMLPEPLALAPHAVPLPGPQSGEVWVSGVVPYWVHLVYSRWLRGIGMSPISVWYARGEGRPVRVHPPVTDRP